MNHRGKQDDGISFVRLISMLMIIACHIFQYLGNGLAGWLNSTTVCIWELDLPVALQSVIICVLILAESFFIVWCSKGIRYLLHHVLNHKNG